MIVFNTEKKENANRKKRMFNRENREKTRKNFNTETQRKNHYEIRVNAKYGKFRINIMLRS